MSKLMTSVMAAAALAGVCALGAPTPADAGPPKDTKARGAYRLCEVKHGKFRDSKTCYAWTPVAARAFCARQTKGSCDARRLPQVAAIKGTNGCWIYRNVMTGKVGAQWGCNTDMRSGI